MKRIALLLCLLTTFTLPLLAQKYIIDDNFGDSVNIFKITLSDPQSDEETLGEPAFKMAMGEEVEVTFEQIMYAFGVLGTPYAIPGHETEYSHSEGHGHYQHDQHGNDMNAGGGIVSFE